MWNKVRSPLLFLSLGMNIAFLVVLGFLVFPGYGLDGDRDRHLREHRNDEWEHDRDRDPGWHFYKRKIGVSDTQWENIRPPMESFHAEAYEICKKIHSLKNRLLTLIESPDTNAEAIRSTEEKILELRRRKQRLFVDYMTEKKEYLKPSQQKRFFKVLRKHKKCDKHARFLEKLPASENGNHSRE